MQKIAVYWEKTYTVYTTQYALLANRKIFYLTIIHPYIIYLYMSQTNSTYHSPSPEPNISSVNQFISLILWNSKVHHTFQQRPLLVPILSQLNPVHVYKRYTFKIHFIKRIYVCVWLCVCVCVCVCTNGHILSGIRTKTPEHIFVTRTRSTCTAHLILLVAVPYHLVYPSV